MPRSGVRTPEITSKSVVFPAPFGPMSPHTSPADDREGDVGEGGDTAEAHADALEREHGRVDVLSVGARAPSGSAMVAPPAPMESDAISDTAAPIGQAPHTLSGRVAVQYCTGVFQ